VARRAAVKAAVISSAVFLTPLFGAVPAHAEPASQQLRAEDLPPELVQAVSRDLHMSPEEYLDLAARAQELQEYAADFRAERPDVFAGAWMTPEGKPVVAVTSPAAAKEAGDAGYHTRLAPVSA